MLDRIKILLFGSDWDEIRNCIISEDREQTTSVYNSSKQMTGSTEKKNIAIMIQMESDCISKKRLNNIAKSLLYENAIAYYFLLKHKNQIRSVREVVRELALGDMELYGIDPDYFYSIVPITGNCHKPVERYIQELKGDFTIKGKIKNIIKSFLININLSKVIYEGFVISVNRLPHL